MDNCLAARLDAIRHLGRTVDCRIKESTGSKARPSVVVDIPHTNQQRVHRIRSTLWICLLAGMAGLELRDPAYLVATNLGYQFADYPIESCIDL